MSEEDYELMEKNLAGTASASEQDMLSRKLADPVFRKDYEEFAEVQKAIRVHERSRLKKLLVNEEAESTSTRTIPLWPWAIAASVTFILAISYFVWNSSDNVAGEYYATYTEFKIDKPRGAADDYRLKVSAYEAYKNEQTSRALNSIDTLLVVSPDDEEALFIRGLIYLQWERYPSAREDLERVKAVDNVQWFLALAYLGEKNIAGGKSVLEEIAKDEKSPFRDRALKLLKEL